MKAVSAYSQLRASLTAVTFFASSLVGVNAGFIDLLRGEEAAPERSFQRVAFVGPARVKEVQGEAERLVGIDAWKRLEKGAELAPGDVVRTRNGTVVLRMSESGSFVKVTPRTILRLVPLDQGRDRSVLSGREERKGFVVRSCRGKATVRRPGGDWKNVEVNAVLSEGAELWTEPGTMIDLFDTKTQRPVRIHGSALIKLHGSAFANRVLVQPGLVAAARP
jgi:hypothetical protein